MQQRDLLKDQIEQLGRVLGQILSRFLELKNTGNTSQAIEVTNESLKELLSLNLEDLMKLNNLDLPAYFKSKLMTSEHIAQLADYMIAVADHTIETDQKKAIELYTKVVSLYDHLVAETGTFSFDRYNKEKSIKNLLEQFNS